MTHSTMGEEEEIQKELNLLMEKEDLKLRQMAKRNWYALGDRNIKFFHACATQRRRKNFIRWISSDINQSYINAEEINEAFWGYFNNFFTSSNPSRLDIEKCIGHITPCIIEEMHSQLEAGFTREEIETTLNQMAPLKAPGPNGFGACFYKKNWAIISDDVCVAVLQLLKGKGMNSNLNQTFIALIPKV